MILLNLDGLKSTIRSRGGNLPELFKYIN